MCTHEDTIFFCIYIITKAVALSGLKRKEKKNDGGQIPLSKAEPVEEEEKVDKKYRAALSV